MSVIAPAVEVRDLFVHFPIKHGTHKAVAKAVDGVSLSVASGEILALVGESGCGKTTIARTVMRLEDPTGGHILLGGADVTKVRGRQLRALRREFQMVFQDPFESLDPKTTALETVMEGLRIHSTQLSRGEREREALAALDQAGLRPASRIAGRFLFQLSGGQRQRVAIAAAVALRPRLIVADEPVSMLDISLRAGIIRLMLDLRDQLGISYLFITHDLSLAAVFADRIVVLYLGRVVEEGPAAEVISSPNHPYTRALVSVMPNPDPAVRDARVLLSGEPPNPTEISSGCRFRPRCPLYRALGEPERCHTEDPALQAIADSAPSREHRVACHFPSDSGSGTYTVEPSTQ